MEWLELNIDTSHAGLDAVTDMLEQQGVTGLIIDDEADFQSFLENNHQYWDYVDEDLEASMKGKSRITFYLPADGDGFDQLAHLRTALQGFKDAHAGKYGTLLMTLENLKDADWENNWKQYYKPMEIGERLLVIPEWEQENVKGQAKYAGKVPLILEPGLTFGTGSHATTRLCLTALEEAVHGGETVLDLGCGSGILSIAALRLGAASAKAVDIDDKCLTVAYENAALNGVADKLTVLVGDLSDKASGKYDIITANIVANAEQKTRESLERANARIEELTQDIIRVEKNRDAAWERFSEVSKQLDAAEASLKNKTLALTSLINDLEALGVEPKKHNTEEEQK